LSFVPLAIHSAMVGCTTPPRHCFGAVGQRCPSAAAKWLDEDPSAQQARLPPGLSTHSRQSSLQSECGLGGKWPGGHLFERPPYLEDQSTDEGSTDFGSTGTSGDISSALTSPNTTPSAGASCKAKTELLAPLCQGYLADAVISEGVPTSHPWGVMPMSWAAEGTHDDTMPMLGSGVALFSTAPSPYAAFPQQSSLAPPHQPVVLGTTPLGCGGMWCTFNGGPAPAPIRAPLVMVAEELEPPGPHDAPLKVSMVEFECEVVHLDPRLPAKKRPPTWR